jgi:hypothetical protein
VKYTRLGWAEHVAKLEKQWMLTGVLCENILNGH